MWPLLPFPRARVRNVWQILLPGSHLPLPLSAGKDLVVEDDAAELAKDCGNELEPLVPALASASGDDVAAGPVCVRTSCRLFGACRRFATRIGLQGAHRDRLRAARRSLLALRLALGP